MSLGLRAQTAQVGDIARNFTVYDHLTGAPINLSDFTGKIVVVNFFAHWSLASQSASALVETEIQKYYAARGGNASGIPVVVLSVSLDSGNSSALEGMIRTAGLELVGEDLSESKAAAQFDTSLIPVYVVVNGVPPEAAAGMKQWQILSLQVGYPGSFALRKVIDAVQKPAATQPPVIQQPPQALSVVTGQPAVLSVVATGWPTPTYQWLKGGMPIAGATSASLWIPAARAGDADDYSVTVTNQAGTATSSVARLGVFSAIAVPAAKAIGVNGGKYQIEVSGTGSWSVSKEATWLTVSSLVGSGTDNLTLVVQPNDSGATRTAAVTIGDFVHTVTQADAEAPLTELWGVGDNEFGLLGDHMVVSERALVNAASQVTAIAAGDWHSAYVTADGTLWTTGSNRHGQLGDSSLTHRGEPVKVATGVQTVSAGSVHTLFLKSDGTLWGMGSGTYGQLGPGVTSRTAVPIQIAAGVVAIDAGSFHSVFLKEDGTLWGMGSNGHGQLGDGTRTSRATLAQIAADVKAFSAGDEHTVFVKNDGTLWVMGQNDYGELGLGTLGSAADSLVPVQVALGVSAVSAGYSHTLFLKTDATLWGMGSNSFGRLGDGSALSRTRPVQIATGVKAISAGRYHSLFVKLDDTAWSMGFNGDGQLGQPGTWQNALPRQVAAGVKAVAAGGFHSQLLGTDGVLQVVGSNSHGQLGLGRVVVRSVPVQLATAVVQMASSSDHTLWVDGDGTLWGTGNNSSRALGVGSREIWSTATQVATGVEAVTTGAAHSLFVRTDGTLWGMGDNTEGQLGIGAADAAPFPVQIAADVRAVAAGSFHTLFLKSDGNLWAMGANDDGQLGDGTVTMRTGPVQVASGVRQIAANGYHSLFIKNDGTLWAMGNNISGELGDGTTTNRSTPVQIATGVMTVAAGHYHSLYATTDGTLWGMGYNGDGQIEGSGVLLHPSPVQAGSAVQAVAAGAYHSLVLTTDGAVWTMGRNDLGQLGDGTTSRHTGAARIAYGVSAIAAGESSSFYVTSNGPLAIARQPASAAVPAGGTAIATMTATGRNTRIYQWFKNGLLVTGATNPTLTLETFQPADAGLYSALVAESADALISSPVILGLTTTDKVVGGGKEVGSNITLANGRVFDQVLLQGSVASITADAGQVTRISYVDTQEDIVQVEFAGAGTLTLTLSGASGPATPVNYNQPTVEYMKGRASIVIVGADETSNLSVFSVGRANAVNQALFRSEAHYDGMADIGYIAIQSSKGKFGGLRAANARFHAAQGFAGVYAPKVEFNGPVYIGDINASEEASAMLVLGAALGPTSITGGDLAQDNGYPVEVSGLARLTFAAGSTSHGDLLPAQANQGRLLQDGKDVTSQIVVNPTP